MTYTRMEMSQNSNRKPLRIFFHIGPHKTGTSSIQSYFLNRFGSKMPCGSVWYPVPQLKGSNAHVNIASIMNSSDFRHDSNPLRLILKELENKEVEKLILSAEQFIHAYPDKIQRYADTFEGHDLVLITTQNSLINRVASLWQEIVKQNSYTEQIAYSKDRILNDTAYQVDFLRSFIEVLKPISTRIIYSSHKDAPQTLIKRVLDVMELSYDLEYESIAKLRRNMRSGFIETEILRNLNILLHDYTTGINGKSYTILRNQLLNCFNSDTWKNNCPKIPIDTPVDLKKAIFKRALEIKEEMENLEKDYNVEIYGSPEVLLEDGN